MSIYIKGMEMPTSCDMCWALDDYGDYPRCRITDEQRGYNFPVREKRMDKCPLVPIPPHGDLIDRDALKAKQQEDADLFINAYTLMEKTRRDEALNAVANIVNAPTIIPAEEGEE